VCGSKKKLISLINVGYTGVLGPALVKCRNDIDYVLSFNPLYKSFDTRKHRHLQLAVSNIPGIKNFNIFKKRNCSSLFDLDKNVLPHRQKDPSDLDIEKIVKVNCIRLDKILDLLKPTFNFLMVDAQGSDLSVIKSLGKHIEHIWCIQLEVFFTSFYYGAPMVDEVLKYMESIGNFRLLGNMRKPNPLFGDFIFINGEAPREFIDIIGKAYNCEISLV